VAKFDNTLAGKRKRAAEVYERLHGAYPDATCSLDFDSPLQLMIATILAAQCTDARVNLTTPELFEKFPTAQDLADAPIKEIEKIVQPCGFYRNKAKNIRAACRKIVDEHAGDVPGTMEELVALPGVGRKTANVIRGECFGGQGVVVDTHCGRISRRLGFTKLEDPVKVERALMKVWPEEHWTLFSHCMVFHGRAICTARAPKCSECPVADLCPFPHTREGKRIAK
jgi:endonuclease-3